MQKKKEKEKLIQMHVPLSLSQILRAVKMCMGNITKNCKYCPHGGIKVVAYLTLPSIEACC